MRIIFNVIYFFVFIIMAIVAMFLGGVSGVAGTFYVLVEPGDIETNLMTVMAILVLIWLLVIMLRSHNKKIIKRKQFARQQEQ